MDVPAPKETAKASIARPTAIKKLVIKSTYRGGAMYVEISQEIINPKPASAAR